MAGGIRFSISSSQDIIVTWAKATSPSVEVGRSAPFAPSTSAQTLTPGELEAVTYIFRWYTTPDGSTLQTLLASWTFDGRELMDTEFVMYDYVVGRGSEGPIVGITPQWSDPVPGATRVYDERLTGKSYVAFRRGIGPFRADEINDTGHGFELTTPGDVLNEDEVITVLVNTGRVAAPQGNAAARTVSVEETATADYFNVHNIAAFGGPEIVTTTLPPFASIPDGKTFEASTHSDPTLRYWILQLSGTDTIALAGHSWSRIILGAGEHIKLVFKNVAGTMVAYVLEDDTNYRLVGEVVCADNKEMPGTVLADGTKYDIGEMPRLYDVIMQQTERVITSTPINTKWNETEIVTVAPQKHQGIVLVGTGTQKTYFKNRGKFVVDDVSEMTFYVPDERGQSFRVLKNFDGTSDADRLTQGAGGRQAQGLIEHGHAIATTSGVSTTSDSADALRGGLAGSVSTRGKNGTIGSTGDTEQRLDNTGKYALIHI